jgi:type III secretion protein Q
MVHEELYEDDIDDLTDDEATEPHLNESGTGFSHKAFEQPTDHNETEGQATKSEWGDDSVSDGRADGRYEPRAAECQISLDCIDLLPLALTIRCGSLDLTLGELRRIAAGTVFPVNGVTPGFATLCHGERVIAEGELVSIEGRLGLQITRTALHS